MLGATVGEVPNGPSGDTRAFDARTGKKLWEFHTVPRPGEVGHETWLDDGWKRRSGMNIWGWYMTVDEQRGILYMPIAGPAANYWGGDRPGNNLFAQLDRGGRRRDRQVQVALPDRASRSLGLGHAVAADAGGHHAERPDDSGARVGRQDRLHVHPRSRHRQADLRRRGAAGAEGRRAGRVVFADAAVPGEAAAAHARRLQQGARHGAGRRHVAPSTSQACQELWDKSGGFYNAGPFTPFMFHEEGAPPKIDDSVSRRHRRRELGRDRRRIRDRLVFVNAHDTSLVGWIEKKKPGQNYGRGTEGSKQPYDRGSVNGAGPYFTFSAPMQGRRAAACVANLPCQRPPWAGSLPSTRTPATLPGRCRSASPMRCRKASTTPAAAAAPVRRDRRRRWSFVGATNDRRFRAFDAKTGKELWATHCRASGNANPITYRGKNGKQYVAIVATDSLQVFSLP